MTSVDPKIPTSQLRNTTPQSALSDAHSQPQPSNNVFKETGVASPDLLRKRYASRLENVGDDISGIKEAVISPALQRLVPSDKSKIFYPENPKVELLDWYGARFFPAIIELSGGENPLCDYTNITSVAKAAPLQGESLVKIFQQLEKDLVALPKENRANMYVVRDLLEAVNQRWFIPQGVILVANSASKAYGSDFFSSIEPRIILAQWAYKIEGRTIPAFITKSFSESDGIKNLGHWNPEGKIEIRWEQLDFNSKHIFGDKTNWADTPLLRTARILDAKLSETYKTPKEYLPYLFETVLQEEVQHARDGYFVAGKTQRSYLYHDDRYALGFNKFNIKPDSLLSKVVGDPTSKEVLFVLGDKNLYKGDLIHGLVELSGQLSAASTMDPRIRLQFWLAYLQKGTSPSHNIASMFGTKLLLDKCFGKYLEQKAPRSLINEKNWGGLFSTKGIETLCSIPEILVDRPLEELRNGMKASAIDNFVVPIDGGIFRTLADNGSFVTKV